MQSEKIFNLFFKKIDIRERIRYNGNMDEIQVAIIGGGAGGLIAAARLKGTCGRTVVFERGARVGKKLSATGNGQGNVSNENLRVDRYFSVEKTDKKMLEKALNGYGVAAIKAFFARLGVLLCADERGRIYPTSRQASSLTDALRFALEREGLETALSTFVKEITPFKKGFRIVCDTENGEKEYFAETVLLCTGGKAAKNFGTDGAGYLLCKKLGHSVTNVRPSLVQFKCDTTYIKTLKGIRVNAANVTIAGDTSQTVTGDLIFTEYGVSGDAIFRLSAFLPATGKAKLTVDLLPNVSESELYAFLEEKRKNVGGDESELLCGILNNQIARAVAKRCAGKSLKEIVATVKAFTLDITGTLGFDYAQVTKGGVPLGEVTESFESKICPSLFFAGEILDVDGECGGYNLHFAFASASVAAKAIEDKYAKNAKTRGQVCK